MPAYTIEVVANTSKAVRDVRDALGVIARDFDNLPRNINAYRSALNQTNKEVNEAARVYRNLSLQQQDLQKNTASRIKQSADLRNSVVKERQEILNLRKAQGDLQDKMNKGSSASWMTRWKNAYSDLGKEIQSRKLGLDQMRTTLAGVNTATTDSIKKSADLTNSIKQVRDVVEQGRTRIQFLRQGIAEMSQETQKGASMMGVFGSAFRGAFVGAVAGAVFSAVIGGITSIVGALKDAVVESINLSAKFEISRNAMALFTGSMAAGRAELAQLGQLAKVTPGLRLEDAEAGAVNLRALGFEVKTVQNLVVGLAKQKLISGVVDEQAMQRTIINIQQLRAGSPQVERDIRQMILAMPSLSLAIEGAFGSIKKFKAELQKDPKAALDKFAQALADTKAPAGGFTDALGKAKDAFIVAGRNFGEPILQPLTDFLKNLTMLLDDNASAFTRWGTTVAQVLAGIETFAKENRSGFGGGGAFDDATNWVNRNMVYLPPFWGVGVARSITEGLNEDGRRALEKKAQERKKQAGREFWNYDKDTLSPFLESPNVYGPSVSALVRGEDGLIDYEKALDIIRQNSTERAKQERDLQQEKERIRRQDLANLKMTADSETAILKSNYEVKRAMLDNSLQYNTQQELDHFKKQNAMELEFLNSERRSKLAQLDKMLSLEEEGSEDYKKLRNERDTYAVTSADAVKAKEVQAALQIKKYELRVLEERREALVEYYQLSTREVSQNLDNQSNIINRELRHQTNDFEQLYQNLIDENFKAFQTIYDNTSKSYLEQLNNQKLTAEQRSNLEREMYLELGTQLENYNRKVQELEDAKLEMQLSRIDAYARRAQQVFDSQAQASSSLGGLFDPEGFSSSNYRRYYNAVLGGDLQKEVDRLRERLAIARDALEQLYTVDRSIADDPRVRDPHPTEPNYDAWVKAKQRVKDVDVAISHADANLNKLKASLSDPQNLVGKLAIEIGALGQKVSSTAGAFELFDVIATKSLTQQQEQARASVKIQLDAAEAKLRILKDARAREISIELERAKNDERQSDIDRWTQAMADLNSSVFDTTALLDAATSVKLLENSMTSLTSEQATQALAQYNSTLAGMDATIQKLKSGDIGTSNALGLLFRKETTAETIKDLQEIARIQHQIANAPQESDTRIRLSAWGTAKEVAFAWEEAQKTIASGALKLADAQIYHQERVQAKLTDWLLSQKSFDDAIADAFIGTWETVFGAMDAGISRLTSKFGIFGDVIKSLILDLAKMALSPLIQKIGGALFGGNNGAGGSSGGGWVSGILGSLGGLFGGRPSGSGRQGAGNIFNTGGSVANFFGGNSPVGRALANSFSGTFNAQNVGISGGGFNFDASTPFTLTRGSFSQDLKNMGYVPGKGFPQAVASNAVNGGFSLKSMGAGLSSMLPMLGISLGSSLGRGFTAPSILGGVGGLLGGIAGMGLLASLGIGGAGLFGTTLATTGMTTIGGVGGLFGAGGMLAGIGSMFSGIGGALGATGAAAGALGATVFLAPIAAALLVGTYFYGRSKKRRQEEQIRTQVLIAAKDQLKKLISDVDHDRVDGESALATAASIREQYMQQVGQLKDKKTRNIALATVREIDALIKGPLKAAVDSQKKRQEISSMLIPEFASGGVIPGIDRGFDSQLIKARPGEVVLTKHHQQMLGGAKTFSAIGVPGFANGGQVRNMISSPTNNYNFGNGQGELTIVVVADESFAEGMVVKGRKEVVKITSDDMADYGKIYKAASKVL